MLSPVWARAAMVMNWAAWPEEAATAATPPSRAAIRFSKTSTVGWRVIDISRWSNSANGVEKNVVNAIVRS